MVVDILCAYVGIVEHGAGAFLVTILIPCALGVEQWAEKYRRIGVRTADCRIGAVDVVECEIEASTYSEPLSEFSVNIRAPRVTVI